MSKKFLISSIFFFTLLVSPISKILVQEQKKPLWPNLANELWKINSGGDHKWPQHSAGDYFSSTAYTYEEYQDFWRRFFAETPKLTSGFSSYIPYSLYYWFTPESRKNSSGGTCIPALEVIEKFAEKGSTEMSRILLEQHKQNLQNFEVYFYLLSACLRDVPENQNLHLRKAIVPRLYALVKKYDFLSPTAKNDKTKYPLLNTYRTAIYNALAEAERGNPEMAKELGFPPLHERIWRKHRVIISDNNDLIPRGLEIIDEVLDHIPSEMHQLRMITVLDYLDNVRGTYSPWRMCNIFGKSKELFVENGFLRDVPPHNSDVYSLVVVHEVNHNVDASTINTNKRLFDRKMDILKRAGKSNSNYLRDQGDGFFENFPQEFFASISNIYFANTMRTFELASIRCKKGIPIAMEQAIFFAEVYSRGGDTAPAYILDEHGKLTKVGELRLKRDRSGTVVQI